MVSLRILIASLFVSNVYAAVIYYDNGVSVYIPESTWEIQSMPKGFNSFPYSILNPKGKLPWFGGWPEYEGCELSLGQPCEEPYFITVPKVEECVPEGELSLGGAPCK